MAKKRFNLPKWGKIVLWVLGTSVVLIVVVFVVWKIWLSTWKTYENKDLGFSFKYPSTWHIVTDLPVSRQQIEKYGPVGFYVDSKEKLPNSPMDPIRSPGDVQVDIGEGKSIIEAHKLQKDFSKLKTVEFGNKSGLVDSGISRTSYSGGLFVFSTSIYVESGNLEYFISSLTISDTASFFSKIQAKLYNLVGVTILGSFIFN